MSGDLLVCEGGPYAGFWWWLSDWQARRQAAQNMGYGPRHPAGTALGYQATRNWRDHPDPKLGRGRVIRWAP